MCGLVPFPGYNFDLYDLHTRHALTRVLSSSLAETIRILNIENRQCDTELDGMNMTVYGAIERLRHME